MTQQFYMTPQKLSSKYSYSITHNSQKVETTKKFINSWMNRQNRIYPDNEVLFSNTNEWSTDTWYNMDESQKHYRWKKPDKKSTYSMIPCIWYVHNRQISRNRKQANGWLGLGVGTGVTANRQKGSFWGDGNVLKLGCGDSCTTLNLLRVTELP